MVPMMIGKTFAYVQHGMDKVIAWGFSTMEEASKTPTQKKPSRNLFLRETARAGRGLLRFVGTLGTEYYKKYDELKKNRK